MKNKFIFRINILISVWLTAIFLLLASVSFGQTKKELEDKRQQIKKEIENTNRLLNQTKKQSKNSLSKLMMINKKINNRNEIISTMSQEIAILEHRVNNTNKNIKSLEDKLNDIKDEYAKLVFYAYKNRNSFRRLMFILAADNFNQAYKRLKYLQEYSEYRKKQASLLLETQDKLNEQIAQLNNKKLEKQKLIAARREEMKILASEKIEQTAIIDDLKRKEHELLNKIAEQQEMERYLETSISAAISNNEKNIEVHKTQGKMLGTSTPDVNVISSQFAKNKGHLPWPTDGGVIVKYFGEQPHAYLKGVRIRNDGVDISTTSGASVHAIFDGVVSKVVTIPGANLTVLINHGDYYTIYSNLVDVTVQSGDVIKKNQKIGSVFIDVADNNVSLLKFQIWKQNTKLDPVGWLSKR